jgi:hypothetical protein
MEVIPENIPYHLKAIDNWVLWKWQWRRTSWDKPPLQRDGRYAATNDKYTWCSFDEAYLTYEAEEYDGIGVVLPDGQVGIDIDDCFVDGELTQEAKLIMSMFPTYAEISPSGTGIKAIAFGHVDPSLKAVDHKRGIEMYEGGQSPRYFTITGNVLDDAHREIVECRQSLSNLQVMISDPLPKPKDNDEPIDPLLKDKVLNVLEHCKELNENYTDWLKVGMALRHVDPSESMFQVWNQWSSTASTYTSEEECRYKWETFTREDGRLVTEKLLFRWAKEHGYDPDKFQTHKQGGIDLMDNQEEHEFLVDDMMVRNEPMVIGGPTKCLKTTIALELAMSIASGHPFLDRFEVKRPCKTLFISGESGKLTIRDTMKQIVASRGYDRELLRDSFYVSFNLPDLDRISVVDDLVSECVQDGIEVVFIDPLYLALSPGEGASNIYTMGDKLKLIASRIITAGITPVLLHHFKKGGARQFNKPELEDLSQSGVAEFARQVILLKRRKQYRMDGMHHLWFYWGGSAGHQGFQVGELYTGTRELGLDWQTTFKSEAEADAAEAAAGEETQREREAKAEAANAADQIELLNVIREQPGLGMNALGVAAGLGRTKLQRLLQELLHDGRIEQRPGPRNATLFFEEGEA